MLAGGAAIYFVFTMSVHGDPEAVPSTAAGVPAGRYSGAVEEGRRLARSLVVEGNLAGLSVAVAHDGQLVWAEGFGWANIERRAPVTLATKSRLGRAAIPLTSAAVGILHERGRLDLDAPIQRYVPAFPQKAWPISTRQLMGHVAGIHRRACLSLRPRTWCGSGRRC